MAANEERLSVPLSGAYTLLAPDVGMLIHDVLARRDPELSARLAADSRVEDTDVELVQSVLYDEFSNEVSTVDWEPTAYGKRVDDALGSFVQRFLIEPRG